MLGENEDVVSSKPVGAMFSAPMMVIAELDPKWLI